MTQAACPTRVRRGKWGGREGPGPGSGAELEADAATSGPDPQSAAASARAACRGGSRPRCPPSGSSPGARGLEHMPMTAIRRVGGDAGGALGDKFRVHHDVASMHVGKEAARLVALDHVQFQPNLAPRQELAIDILGGGAAALTPIYLTISVRPPIRTAMVSPSTICITRAVIARDWAGRAAAACTSPRAGRSGAPGLATAPGRTGLPTRAVPGHTRTGRHAWPRAITPRPDTPSSLFLAPSAPVCQPGNLLLALRASNGPGAHAQPDQRLGSHKLRAIQGKVPDRLARRRRSPEDAGNERVTVSSPGREGAPGSAGPPLRSGGQGASIHGQDVVR